MRICETLTTRLPSQRKHMASQKFDIVIWGATGFTGKLVCEYLAWKYQGTFRWAIAGRDQTRLAALRKQLTDKFRLKDVPLLVGDVHNQDSMLEVAKSTKVLLNTAGPYLRTGSAVINACITSGTHYADITGEVAWIKQTISQYHEPALAAKVKIVHCCGWDCIPADLGTLILAQHAQEKLGRKLEKVTHLVTELAGAFSGGSLNTALDFYTKPFEALFPAPDSLNPPHCKSGRETQQFLGVGYEPLSQLYTSPSIFAPANLRIVRRSNALLGCQYGKNLAFDDVMGHQTLLKAVGATLTTLFQGIVMLIIAHIPALTRWFRSSVAKPGKGPLEDFMRNGSWECLVVGLTEKLRSAKPSVVKASLKGAGDPGYSQTSLMLLEAGICLLRGEASNFCLQGGVLTPASAIGMPLVQRLKAAGITFEIASQGKSQKSA